MANATGTDGVVAPSRRFGLGATLALAMGIGPLAIYALTALSPQITVELSLSRTQLGSLATASFLVAASTSVAGGHLIDRIGAWRVLLVLFATSGIALLAVGIAPDYAWLLVAVAVSGFAQSLSNPVTNQMVASLVAPGRRGTLMGTKQSGVQMSQFVAGATLPAAAALVGWRTATSASVVLAVIGVWLLVVLVPRGGPVPHVEAERDVAGRAPLPPAVWWLTGYIFLMGWGLQATNVHLPLYAFDRIGVGAVVAGATTGVMGAVGLVARIGWGRAAERATAPHRSLTFLALASVAGILALHLASTAWAAFLWVGVVLHGGAALASNVVVMLAALREVSARQVARATGVIAVGMYLGFAIGPITLGGIVDRTDSYATGWSLLAVLYLAAATLIVAWGRRRISADEPQNRPREVTSC